MPAYIFKINFINQLLTYEPFKINVFNIYFTYELDNNNFE